MKARHVVGVVFMLVGVGILAYSFTLPSEQQVEKMLLGFASGLPLGIGLLLTFFKAIINFMDSLMDESL